MSKEIVRSFVYLFTFHYCKIKQKGLILYPTKNVNSPDPSRFINWKAGIILKAAELSPAVSMLFLEWKKQAISIPQQLWQCSDNCY